jgi:hypothetical protein
MPRPIDNSFDLMEQPVQLLRRDGKNDDIRAGRRGGIVGADEEARIPEFLQRSEGATREGDLRGCEQASPDKTAGNGGTDVPGPQDGKAMARGAHGVTYDE